MSKDGPDVGWDADLARECGLRRLRRWDGENLAAWDIEDGDFEFTAYELAQITGKSRRTMERLMRAADIGSIRRRGRFRERVVRLSELLEIKEEFELKRLLFG